MILICENNPVILSITNFTQFYVDKYYTDILVHVAIVSEAQIVRKGSG